MLSISTVLFFHEYIFVIIIINACYASSTIYHYKQNSYTKKGVFYTQRLLPGFHIELHRISGDGKILFQLGQIWRAWFNPSIFKPDPDPCQFKTGFWISLSESGSNPDLKTKNSDLDHISNELIVKSMLLCKKYIHIQRQSKIVI